MIDALLSAYYSLTATYRDPRNRIVGSLVLASSLLAAAAVSSFGLLAAAVVGVLAYAAAVAIAVRATRISKVALLLVTVWALYTTLSRITGFALRLFGAGGSQ
jgi:lysylphosphatidylglycerol synthetase-like protein (DUF2156 family)